MDAQTQPADGGSELALQSLSPALLPLAPLLPLPPQLVESVNDSQQSQSKSQSQSPTQQPAVRRGGLRKAGGAGASPNFSAQSPRLSPAMQAQSPPLSSAASILAAP